MTPKIAHPVRLYLTNLNDKLQKEDLRRALYCLFSTHGPVLDVVALKTMKMRGQAHIVFRDAQTSSQAMRALQGYEFFGRELVSVVSPQPSQRTKTHKSLQKIQFAKGKSATVSKLDGTAEAPKTKVESVPETTEQSIFNAPSQIPQASAQKSGGLKPNGTSQDSAKGSTGVKRPREDESDQENASMDEDDDDAMEESDDD